MMKTLNQWFFVVIGSSKGCYKHYKNVNV